MKEKMDKKLSLLMLILLVSFMISCVSTGNSKLSQAAVENIIEGLSSNREVVKMIGSPKVSLTLDNISLNSYINRFIPSKFFQDIFSEGKYEVWTYYKWGYLALDPLLIPSLESSRVSLLIFDSNGICVKKLYDAEAILKF